MEINQEYIDLLKYTMEKRGREYKNDTVRPIDIFKLANNNPIIHKCVREWEAGNGTWEEVLMLMVKTLVQQNGELIEEVVKQRQMMPGFILVKSNA